MFLWKFDFFPFCFPEMQNGSTHIAREQTSPLDKNSKVSFFLSYSANCRSIYWYIGLRFQVGHKHSPLFSAVFAGDEKTVEHLLTAGADRNIKDSKVQYNTIQKWSSIVRLITDNFIAYFQHGNTPLHEAAWRGYSRCVKTLCTLPKVVPTGKESAKKSKQIKCAIESTQNVLHSTLLSVRNAGGFSALHLAAQNGHNQSCREILLAGVDPDVQNNVSESFMAAIGFIFSHFISLSFSYSMATHHCIQLAVMVMLAQQEFCCRQNAIHCVSIWMATQRCISRAQWDGENWRDFWLKRPV